MKCLKHFLILNLYYKYNYVVVEQNAHFNSDVSTACVAAVDYMKAQKENEDTPLSAKTVDSGATQELLRFMKTPNEVFMPKDINPAEKENNSEWCGLE